MTHAPILLATQLEKTITNDEVFQKKWRRTLWKVDRLELARPCLTVVAGRNGAGKSTLLRCLLGLIAPTRGNVSWFGHAGVSARDLGYVPEFPIIPPTAKVRHWLSWLLGRRPEDLLGLDTELQRFPDLSVKDFLDVPADRLSKGQSQRVQLWAALAQNPKGLVLDEPFSGLDPWARTELSELLHVVLGEGRFVLVSSHEMTKLLRSVCQETWLLREGTVDVVPGCAIPE